MNISKSLALALVLGTGTALAQEPAPPETTPLAQERMPLQETARPAQDLPEKRLRDVHHEKGTVMAVDAATGKLRVKDADGKIRRFFAKKAKINTVEGKAISLADISVGDEVSISYEISVKGKQAIEILRQHKALKR